MAIALVALIGAGSLAVDIGSALVTKSELQNVADAGSLAATRELALIYKSKSANTNYKTYQLTDPEIAQIKAKALAFAAANKAGGLSISVGNDDVTTNTYNIATGDLTPTTTGVRAVRVIGRRDDTQNGQVQTALARVLGINSISITASSTAAISALGSLKPGMGEFPIALDEGWWDTHNCAVNSAIQLYPTGPSSCVGWHSFEENPPSAARIKTIVKGISEGTFQSPLTIAGETYYNFTSGTLSSALDDMSALFEQKKNGSGTWTVNAPVYARTNSCDPPNQSQKIVGFTKVKLSTVEASPADIQGVVECGIYDEGEVGGGGGASDFGVLVGSPGMIQ